MDHLQLYEIHPEYIEYLQPFAPHLFHNKKQEQVHERKYIGILLRVNDCDYFAPLSSFKPKHLHMKNSLDFIKIRQYAVINLNNMFPVPREECVYIDFKTVKDAKYRSLLLAEYRFIKSVQDKIRKNAQTLYRYKLANKDATGLAKRCNDFLLLEDLCKKYHRPSPKGR